MQENNPKQVQKPQWHQTSIKGGAFCKRDSSIKLDYNSIPAWVGQTNPARQTKEDACWAGDRHTRLFQQG
ncbi:hypothetical protein B5F25_17250 [Bacteroides sp. An19]|nr:hypothetical protein B5F25_17250 [Bacteroides sp. An19]